MTYPSVSENGVRSGAGQSKRLESMRAQDGAPAAPAAAADDEEPEPASNETAKQEQAPARVGVLAPTAPLSTDPAFVSLAPVCQPAAGWDRSDPDQDLTDLELPPTDALPAEPPAPAPVPANDTAPELVPPIAAVARVRRHLRVLQSGRTQARTLNVQTAGAPLGRLAREELAAAEDYPDDVDRPRTRGDCEGTPRPCPFVSCRYHLYLDVHPVSGSIKLNHPDLEPWELAETCALDMADRGEHTLEQVGAAVNVTRERIRQLEATIRERLQREQRRGRFDFEEAPEQGLSPLGAAIG